MANLSLHRSSFFAYSARLVEFIFSKMNHRLEILNHLSLRIKKFGVRANTVWIFLRIANSLWRTNVVCLYMLMDLKAQIW